MDSSRVIISNVKWLPTLVDDMGYANLQYNSGKFGIELFYFDYGSQTEADQGGIIIGDFNSSSTKVGFSYGHDLNGWLLGGRFNVYQHDIYETEGTSMNYGLDFGVHKQFNNTSLGLVLKDLGGTSKFSEEDVKLPISFGIGVKHSIKDFSILSDVKLFEDYSSFGIGGEYLLGNTGSVRLGYYSEPEFEVDYITFGGGIVTEFINIDLAYLINKDSFHNETLMLSFGFDF